MYLQATTTYGSLIPGSEYIRNLVRQGKISPEAAKKLRWMDHYHRHRNARLTCRYFGLSPKTFYRWRNRFDPYDLTTLEEESRRPRHVRQPQTPAVVVDKILELRSRHPRWEKKKLVVLLAREGIDFEEECQAQKILLFVLPPRSPKLNGHVERANRTHREEFYEVYNVDLDLEEHNKQLAKWEYEYNYVRPHQSLDYLIPDQYYRRWKRGPRQKALPM